MISSNAFTLIVWPYVSKNLFVKNVIPKNCKVKKITLWNLFFSKYINFIQFHWIEYLFVTNTFRQQIKYHLFIFIIYILKIRRRRLIYTFHNLVPNHIVVNDFNKYINNYDKFLNLTDAVLYMNIKTLDIAAKYNLKKISPAHHVWHGFIYPICIKHDELRNGVGIFGSNSKYKSNNDLLEITNELCLFGHDIEFYGSHWSSLNTDFGFVLEDDVVLENWLASKEFILVTNKTSLNSGVIWHALGCGSNVIITNPNLINSVPNELKKYVHIYRKGDKIIYRPVPDKYIAKYNSIYVQSEIHKVYSKTLLN